MLKYDFLNDKERDSQLDSFQLNKARWLQQARDYTTSTKRSYWIFIEKNIHPIEMEKLRDVSDFTTDEVLEGIKNMDTIHFQNKMILATALSNYFDFKIGKEKNPLNNIDIKKTVATVDIDKFKSSYLKLNDFYNILDSIGGSDVDKMVLVLLRYGVSIGEISSIKWTDVKGSTLRTMVNGKETFFPIDNRFKERVIKAKACDSYAYKNFTLEYEDYGYIIKTSDRSKVKGELTKKAIYSKLTYITENNGIERLKVVDLNRSRKYDIMFNILYRNGLITMSDLEEVLILFDGTSNSTKLNFYKTNFETLSGFKVQSRHQRLL